MESISVVIPTFNREHCINRALDSVLAQSYLPTEIVVVDDGSTDSTATLISKHGIRESIGEWVAFLDSDDEWLPQKLERQFVASKEASDYRLVHCDEIWIRNGKRVNAMNKHEKSGGHIFEKCLPLCAISPSAAVIKRDLLLEVGLFDEALPACEDYDLWLKICSREPVLYVEEKLLVKYGGHDDQLSRKHWGMDRFRVTALSNLVLTGALNVDQQTASKKMLIEKCHILLNGAEKRGNDSLKMEMEEMLSLHGAALNE